MSETLMFLVCVTGFDLRIQVPDSGANLSHVQPGDLLTVFWDGDTHRPQNPLSLIVGRKDRFFDKTGWVWDSF